ncbi:hypothetical protein TNIN_179111 [Trichonephila inaurata madagascariensis]|uniref:Uncharacterized protein n=1 Tax=Trichonephila inaurata madagascariensis TaxID=2747483 RepID=A0A8X6Y6A3_9ARAC|nr:hypothetical protein TNIN_179111 [Trichonephila inaurata madagascariensis]
MQGCTEDYSVIKVEFIRTEEGFQYNKEFKQENAERVHAMMSNHVSWTVTPEAWLDIVIQASAIVFPMLKMRTPQRTIIHIWDHFRASTTDVVIRNVLELWPI